MVMKHISIVRHINNTFYNPALLIISICNSEFTACSVPHQEMASVSVCMERIRRKDFKALTVFYLISDLTDHNSAILNKIPYHM